MKLIVSRKNAIVHSKANASENDLLVSLNSGFGASFRAMPDAEVPGYIEAQALRGFVCYEFDHAGTYQSQTTIIKSQAA